MNTNISVYPIATEKAYGLSQSNAYIFRVPTGANKQQIALAIESQFNVKVSNVKTLVQKGKAIRVINKRRSIATERQDFKKAYVSLSEGTIKVFEEPTVEEPAKKADKKETK